MDEKALGRLENVDLRDIWVSEASDFTPWLARDENLQLLGEALGIPLELEAQEKNVGPFRADILCKDVETDRWVLVENQLERTDHNHLGQLLTYAAGLQAVTIVWIAANFTEEHRATLDWLNEITDESFHFFGLEVELWRIGNSPAAPRFNMVSKPNDWSKAVNAAARRMDTEELSEVRRAQLEYWDALYKVLENCGAPFNTNRTARPQSWTTFPIGRSKFHLAAVMQRQEQRVRTELYIRGSEAKAHFNLLLRQKEEVERELGYPLDWEELPQRQDARVAVYLNDVDPENREDWGRQHQWLAERLVEFHRVFAPRIKSLDTDEWSAEEEAAS